MPGLARLITVITVVLTSLAAAQTPVEKAKALTAKYAGSYDTDAFLAEPAISAPLKRLLGTEYAHLIENLFVKGSVDLIGGTLTVNGNASHGGGEEEAVVCVGPHGPVVQAAILSKGTIAVYSAEGRYDAAMICIKDWITQANSQHVDRMEQPKNVRVVKRP